MLGEPSLVTRHDRGDAQGEAFLAEQRVAAVARAERPDFPGFGKLDDPFLLVVARPIHVLRPGGERRAHRMHAGNESTVFAEVLDHGAAHPCHQLHVDDDVRRVRQLDANLRDVGPDGPHGERHDIQRTAAHAAIEQAAERRAHLGRINPVIGRTGVVLAGRTDEGTVLHPRHVRRIRARQIATWTQPLVQLGKGAGGNQLGAKPVVLLLRAVAPHHAFGLGQSRHFSDPIAQLPMLHPVRGWGKIGLREMQIAHQSRS